jgi:prolipoprotein diacylglyceryl transferase
MPGPFVHNIDPIYAEIGGVYIWFYGTSFTAGFLGVFLWIRRKRKELGLSISEVYSLTILIAALVLFFGRMVEVIFYEWGYDGSHILDIPAAWLGGMSTHGILFGGVAGTILFCRLYTKSFLSVADCLAIAAAYIMGMGRIGNFIDGQIVGSLTNGWWGVKFPDAEGFRHPVVLYDGIKNILLIPLLLLIRRYNPPPGSLMAHFFLWYGLLRIPIDFFREYRTDLFGFPPGQEFNLFMAALGGGLLIWFYKKASRGNTSSVPVTSAGLVHENVLKRLWVKRIILVFLLLFPTIIPSDWTQDIPKRYGKRHKGLHYSIMYPRIEEKQTNTKPNQIKKSTPTADSLSLRLDKSRYYLGGYVYALIDHNKNMTIKDVSSAQMASRFSIQKNRIINLGLNDDAYWLRFSIDASEVLKLPYTWLLYFGWPNRIDRATIYIPSGVPDKWNTKEIGRMHPDGPDPLPSSPFEFPPLESLSQPVTFYVCVESSETKLIPLQVLTVDAYDRITRLRSIGFGVYYGIMLSMFLYNLVWFLFLRERNRLYYLIYLFFVALVFLKSNGVLWEFFHIDVQVGEILVFFFICISFLFGILFARSFLITRDNAPFYDKLLFISLIVTIVIAGLLPFVDIVLMTRVISVQSILVPAIFLMTAFEVWRKGFHPARFFLMAFSILSFGAIYEALSFLGLLPFITRHGTQIGSALEVILLQLALAERVRTLTSEQERIKKSLQFASQVQQSLLPEADPQIDGLDIAGMSIYCDETGGDYYDYIIHEPKEKGKIEVAIGDVSGHGISSALLMTSLRSHLRQRSAMGGDISSILTDVNYHIAKDVKDSGQFVTLFYLVVDREKRSIQWVRAGHDPAIFYDPLTNGFSLLEGPGIALGVIGDWQYEEYGKPNLLPGQIIFLGTDGIWEATNKNGEMFGKQRIYDVIRKNVSGKAVEILEALLADLMSFKGNGSLDDDLTMLTIKILPN